VGVVVGVVVIVGLVVGVLVGVGVAFARMSKDMDASTGKLPAMPMRSASTRPRVKRRHDA